MHMTSSIGVHVDTDVCQQVMYVLSAAHTPHYDSVSMVYCQVVSRTQVVVVWTETLDTLQLQRAVTKA